MTNRDFLIVRLLSNIADINYSLGDYNSALYYYDKAINIPIYNNKIEAESKAIAIINKVSSYIQLKNYKEAIDYSINIDNLLHSLSPDVRDDVEILNYNNLALANVYLGNLDLAQNYINLAYKLLKNDNNEFTLNKEYFLSFTYAEFYKKKGQYDKSLELFSILLNNINNKGLGLEENIYRSIRDIYDIKNEFDNYKKYNNLYIKSKNFNQEILRNDYINNSVSMYEREQLKLNEFENKLKLRVLTLLPIGLLILLAFKINSIKKLKLSNFTNSMTNLYNRSYLDYYMKKNRHQLLNTNISILLLDIDYFKNYNDNYGHLKGDDIIREVANILKTSVRPNDICIRYGGEEMVVILPNTSLNICKNIASNLQLTLYNRQIEHLYSNISTILTVSIGIYTHSFSSSDNIYDFINKADQALYKAKANGRNRFEVFLEK
ncbi:MAG: tetratricopeptide repeat-containing diguanylate cyclase [Paraclostridium sp.]